MSEAFDVNQYWLKRGRRYIEEKLPQDYHRMQEGFLLDVLEASRIPLHKLLEVGCGFGRVTKLLAEKFPQAQITALDLSLDQLTHARQYCGEATNITFQQYDFYSGMPWPGTGYDACLAIEVFLHHPRSVVGRLFESLSGIAQHIVNIDWSEAWPWKTAEHVWVHDYKVLYAEAGLKCATFVMPRKIDGMQQKLFIAGKDLSPDLILLERQIEARQSQRTALSKSPHEANETPMRSANWLQQLHLAMAELAELVPARSSLILVNEDQWGGEQQALKDRRVIPFLERDGNYWGPPPEDESAIRELERLREEGADYIAFAWHCFWWLEHYRSFHDHLRERYRCLRADDRLVLFHLK
jgi:SAM-dependent methyltransferase